jgi:hypothetical protein
MTSFVSPGTRMSNKLPLGSGGSQVGSYELNRNNSQEMSNVTHGDSYSFTGSGPNIIGQGQVLNELSVSGGLSPPFATSASSGIKKINITFNNQSTSQAIAQITGGHAFINLRESG